MCIPLEPNWKFQKEEIEEKNEIINEIINVEKISHYWVMSQGCSQNKKIESPLSSYKDITA